MAIARHARHAERAVSRAVRAAWRAFRGRFRGCRGPLSLRRMVSTDWYQKGARMLEIVFVGAGWFANHGHGPALAEAVQAGRDIGF